MNLNTNPLQFIGTGLIDIFGSPIIVMIIFSALVVFLLLMINAEKSAVVIILLPLITTIAGQGISSYISISGAFQWVNVIIWGILGVVFARVYWVVLR